MPVAALGLRGPNFFSPIQKTPFLVLLDLSYSTGESPGFSSPRRFTKINK